MLRFGWTRPLRGVLAALAAWLAAPGAVRADVLVSLVSVDPITSGAEAGDFRYTYGATITGEDTFQGGDFLTLYDFYGYVPGSVTGPGPNLVVSEQGSGLTPPGLSPTDNPEVPNLTFTYDGAKGTLNAATFLGYITAISTIGRTGTTDVSGQTHNGRTGDPKANLTATIGPSAVPEPATVVMVVIAVPALFLLRRRFQRVAPRNG
jgi:hypothetical protein